MEYGLRRYEAVQRLLWFLFFLVCLGVAYPVAKAYRLDNFGSTMHAQPFQTEVLKSLDFWTQLQWLQVHPLGRATMYLIWVALLFMGGRFLWLLVQFAGNYLMKNLLAANIKKPAGHSMPAHGQPTPRPDRSFPTEDLLKRVNQFPLRLIFHSYQRLRLMLSNPQGTLSSEELTEKERRIVETDWQILWSSWTPFRWLLWVLPLLGLIQATWLFYLQLQPALSGQKDLQDLLGPISTSLLPLVQMIVIAVLISLISGLLRRLENLYLSNVDALFYDQFLSRLPFQSSDTLILLEAMDRHFRELRNTLDRLERSLGNKREFPEAES